MRDKKKYSKNYIFLHSKPPTNIIACFTRKITFASENEIQFNQGFNYCSLLRKILKSNFKLSLPKILSVLIIGVTHEQHAGGYRFTSSWRMRDLNGNHFNCWNKNWRVLLSFNFQLIFVSSLQITFCCCLISRTSDGIMSPATKAISPLTNTRQGTGVVSCRFNRYLANR